MNQTPLSRIFAIGVLLGLVFPWVFLPLPGTGTGSPNLPSKHPSAPATGLSKRQPWTTSHIHGSPEPPPPYKMVRAFPKLTFNNPLHLTAMPGSKRFFVCEQAGKIFSFPMDATVDSADLVIDLAKDLHSWDTNKVRGMGDLYALAFHPQFAKNRFCYVCYVLNGKGNDPLADGSRISRFEVSATDPPRIDPRSEKIILTWLAGGHNGCDLHFGPDGYLYISTGDGASPNPPDALNTGQDISDLLSSILRIDVDRAENGKPYAIPRDNPFIKTPKARPEVWAYGFRNPWRMSFDRPTGDLWVGDVGWEQWEMIYRVQKGGNYGWSVMEGPQPVRPESPLGPTPILPPALSFPHTEAASITGGYVYRGKSLKDLQGVYLCGDWVTRKVWGTRFDGDKILWHKELALGKERVVAFGVDHDEELYIVNHDEKGSIHQLAPNEAVQDYRADFPKKLSETGLFASVKDHVPAVGVVPFQINAELWADHASAERFLALPGTSTVKIYDTRAPWPDYRGEVFFPQDGVLAKTFTLEMERGNPRSRRRVETQILHFDGNAWKGYSYAWNEKQTDASLVPAAGLDRNFTVVDALAPGGKHLQRWHYPSRTECLTCHNPWAGYALAFNAPQLNRKNQDGDSACAQLPALQRAGLVQFLQRDWEKSTEKPLAELPTQRWFNPHDTTASLDERARSYLQVNCSHCHQFGAGGTADIDLRFTTPLDQMKTLEVRPVQGNFEIPAAQILAPADPYRSVLYYRMAKLGPGRMPHMGSSIVDERGLRLIHDWIRQLPIRKDERVQIENLRSLDESYHRAREKKEWKAQLQQTAQEIALKNDRKQPIEEDLKIAEENLRKRSLAQVIERAATRKTIIKQLFSSTSSALMLANALDSPGVHGETSISKEVRQIVLETAATSSESHVRDLFERFIPDDQRVHRLGNLIRPEQILQKKGNAENGKSLFFKSAGTLCVNCHRVAGTGSTLGPDLSEIGKKYTRAQILESILEPSKFIDPKYVTYLLETNDGRILTGILAEKNDREVVLRTAGDKELRVPAPLVSALLPQQKSLMPELLLRDLTLEQAADLLEFLANLK